MFMVEARGAREAATACYREKFGVEPRDEDNFRDTSRTSTGKIARISIPTGASIDEALVGVFTFDRYGEMTGTIMVEFDETGFTVEPMALAAACTPYSVSAHMLYENSDPFRLHEPGGHLDVTAARYAALDERRVRVEGSRWVPGPYTVKLEGARAAGYQTTILAILRDPRYVARARDWVAGLQAFLAAEISRRMGLEPPAYTLEFRLIGIEGALGAMETRQGQPVEVGVLGIVTAASQALASEIGKLINPFVLHHPLTPDEELPTFAFPYSPATTDRGALYEFALNHVMRIDEPMDAFRLTVTEVNHARR